MLAAAYRHCTKMEHEAEARMIDYSAKGHLAHEEFRLPPDAPDWARQLIADRSIAGAAEAFWNRVESFEKRADAQLAKEFIIALPVELSREQNIALMREFVRDEVLARGQIADWVYHDDAGNPHVHLMTTLRSLTEHGFGPKKVAVTGKDGEVLRDGAGKIIYRPWAGEKAEFLAARQAWLDLQNRHLALAGLDIRVDGRSYLERGLDVVAMPHIGVAARSMSEKARQAGGTPDLDAVRLLEERRRRNAARIAMRPELVLDLITSEKSVFDARDVAKILYRSIDDADEFQCLLSRVLQSPECLRLEPETIDPETGARLPARLTTREMIRLESEMVSRADWLAKRSGFSVATNVLARVLARHGQLSEEQRAALEYITTTKRIAAVVGRAGAGKTTMMRVAREAWEAAGYRVVGGALAGKAAEGLAQEAGIHSRTLSAWELAWRQGRDRLDEKTVFVLDEAGMVASRQMAGFVETVTRAGAKLVLIGDPSASYRQQLDTISMVKSAADTGATRIVLPESAFGFWTSTMERNWKRTLAGREISVIGGAVIVNGKGYDNVMIEVTGKRARILYRERMPVPLSMWHPFEEGGARANLFANPVGVFGDTRIAPLICYEQLLVWPILHSLWFRPAMIVAIGNGWWTDDTRIIAVQRASVEAWASLFGVSLVTAFNR